MCIRFFKLCKQRTLHLLEKITRHEAFSCSMKECVSYVLTHMFLGSSTEWCDGDIAVQYSRKWHLNTRLLSNWLSLLQWVLFKHPPLIIINSLHINSQKHVLFKSSQVKPSQTLFRQGGPISHWLYQQGPCVSYDYSIKFLNMYKNFKSG